MVTQFSSWSLYQSEGQQSKLKCLFNIYDDNSSEFHNQINNRSRNKVKDQKQEQRQNYKGEDLHTEKVHKTLILRV